MDFIVSNFEFKNSERIGDLYYAGNCTKLLSDKLFVRQSSDFRFFGEYAEKLHSENVREPIMDDDFYFASDYQVGDKRIVLQTDIIGYEAVFVWKEDNKFAFSDDVLELAKAVNTSKVGIVELDEAKVREFLFYSFSLFDDTVFTNIKRLPPASIIEINTDTADFCTRVYDEFIMSGEYRSTSDAADGLDNYLDRYFKYHYQEGVKYGIGMSGGLDSRVGAYYAKKNGYDIKPIFIGVKRNKLGIKTNDVKRAEAVNKYFELDPITYYDPRRMTLRDKVAYDSVGAPNMSSNIHQNMGRIEGFDVLINAMMGGEAFGQLVPRNIENYTDEDLSNAILYRFCGKPKYKTSSRTLIRLSKYILPESFARKFIYTDDSVSDELISRDLRNNAEKRVLDWVKDQKKLGLSNGNIWHKMFYYRIAVIAKTGYYSTFNNSIASLPTYINAGFVREMLNWKSEFLCGKPIQIEFIKKLGNLADLRSQTFDPSINSKKRFYRIKKMFYILERAIRGGAMIYPAWFSKNDILEYKEKYISKTKIGNKISLQNKAWYIGESKWFTVMKLAFIEEYIE